MPSPNPSLNPVAFDGPTGTQWGGGNMGAINDEESRKETRNRQYGYAIMACAVVALAVLMVSAKEFSKKDEKFVKKLTHNFNSRCRPFSVATAPTPQ